MDKKSISVPDMRRILGLSKTEAYWLIKRGHFEIKTVGSRIRVMIDSFEDWYSKQYHYKKVDGSPPGRAYGDTISIAEAASLLGISASAMRDLVVRRGFPTVVILDCIRIHREDFEHWYNSQNRYHKVDGPPPAQKFPQTITAREAANLLGVHRNTIYDLIGKQAFETLHIDGHTLISAESFECWYRGQSHYRKVSSRRES